MIPKEEKVAIVQLYIHIVKDQQVDIRVPEDTDVARLQLLNFMYHTASHWLNKMGTVIHS